MKRNSFRVLVFFVCWFTFQGCSGSLRDSPDRPDFPSTLREAGALYMEKTEYAFSAEISGEASASMGSVFPSSWLHEDPGETTTVSPFGKQPALTADAAGNLHVVFGRGDEIFYTVSKKGKLSFAKPLKIGEQKKLALGASRGPQIISTKDYLVVAAADHTGKILVYRLKHGASRWSEPVNLLRGDSTAKEGFIALSAGRENQVYAAWLDLRLRKRNNIFSARSSDGGKTWSENKRVYESPGGGVCPCCRPAIAADENGNVYVMFRNELEGARDLYLARSRDGGKSFAAVQKLGAGTWMLDRCPMDGGAVSMDGKGNVGTVWRRENTVYYAEPGRAETKIGEGKASVLVKTSKGNYVAWQQGSQVMILTPEKLRAEELGAGSFPRLASMADGQVVCVWESGGQIVAKQLP